MLTSKWVYCKFHFFCVFRIFQQMIFIWKSRGLMQDHVVTFFWKINLSTETSSENCTFLCKTEYKRKNSIQHTKRCNNFEKPGCTHLKMALKNFTFNSGKIIKTSFNIVLQYPFNYHTSSIFAIDFSSRSLLNAIV